MRVAIIVSLTLHAALVGWGVMSLGASTPLQVPEEKRISVTISQVGDVRQQRKGVDSKKAGEQQTKKAEKPKPKEIKPKQAKAAPKAKKAPKKKAPPMKVASLPPRAVPAQPKPAPTKPKKAEPKKPKPKEPAKPVKTAAPAKAAPPRRNPKPRKNKPRKADPKPVKTASKRTPKKTPKNAPSRQTNDLDSSSLAALINRLPDTPNTESRQRTAARSAGRSVLLEPVDDWDNDVVRSDRDRNRRGAEDGLDPVTRQREIDRLRQLVAQQLSNTWTPPVGAANAQDLVPRVLFRLRKDGTLESAPQVVNGSRSPFFAAAADAAVRAVIQAQPFNLPPERYAMWREVEFDFDPAEMLGG